MKPIFAVSFLCAVVALRVHAADTSVKLSGIHLCCDGCVKGADKAITSVKGVTAECDKEAGTITINAPDKATAQKAVDALVAGGYFGTTSEADIRVSARSGAKAGKVDSLKVSGVHLCCGKCVKSVNEALNKVEGVKGNTATKGAESFEITGNFDPPEVFSALNKAGLAGKVGQ